jgi:hypothetical protein
MKKHERVEVKSFHSTSHQSRDVAAGSTLTLQCNPNPDPYLHILPDVVAQH